MGKDTGKNINKIKSFINIIYNSETDKYVYHGTGKGQAYNIQKDGIMSGANNGEGKPSISFTDNLDYAQYYANANGGSTKSAILRTKLTNDFSLSTRIKDNKGYEYITFEKIPSTLLEIQTPKNDWQPLDDWDVMFNEPLKK